MDKGKIEAMATKFSEKFAINMLKKHRKFCTRGLIHLDATPIFKKSFRYLWVALYLVPLVHCFKKQTWKKKHVLQKTWNDSSVSTIPHMQCGVHHFNFGFEICGKKKERNFFVAMGTDAIPPWLNVFDYEISRYVSWSLHVFTKKSNSWKFGSRFMRMW